MCIRDRFYVKEGVGDVPEGNGNGDYWLHIDQFGYVTFYKDRCAAISGCVDSAIDLAPIWLGDEPINIYPQGTADYQNAKWECDFDSCNPTSDYRFSDIQDNNTDIAAHLSL